MAGLTLEEFLRGLGPGLSPENIFARLMEQTLQEAEPALAEAFLMCAVPHRFDAPLLAALNGGTEEAAEGLIRQMSALSFVYLAPDGRRYYHENARAYLLARAREDAARFRDWSARAADFYEKQLGMKAFFAKRMGPRQAELTPEEMDLYVEVIYHRLAVDDEAAFPLFEQAFWDAEFDWRLAVCHTLVASVREQAAVLTGDRALWLRYYEGRLLEAAQRWAEATEVLEPLLHEELSPKLRSWLTNSLALVYYSQGRWGEALAQYEASLKIERELGDRAGEATTLNNIGNVYDAQGRWGEALAQFEASLQIMRALGDRAGEAATLNNIGNVYDAQGRWGEALAQYEASLTIARALGDRAGEARTLNNIGNVYDAQGRWGEALAQHEASLQIVRELGDRAGEAGTLSNIGNVYDAQGRWGEALAQFEASLKIVRALGDRAGEAQTLNNIGNVYYSQGRLDEAIACYQQSLAIKRELGDLDGETSSLNNIAL
jgi:tetratricopeptide (TPR) repeat protein